MPGEPPAGAAVVSEVKAKIGAEAKSVLRGIEVLAGRATSLLPVSETLREDARKQVGVLVDHQVGLVLGDRPITDLRNLTNKGTRLSALAGAGYRTVGDLVGVTSLQLQRVPRIGEQTAQQVLSAVRRYTGEVRLETRIRFDPDRQDLGQTQLLATLAAVRRADSARRALEPALRAFETRTAHLVRDAEPATSRVAMLLRRRAKKEVALSALAGLEAILSEPRTIALLRDVEQYERAVDPGGRTRAQLWQEYADDAAGFNALLSTVGGHGAADETEAAQGYLSDELRQKIKAVPLDTGLLRATLRGYQMFGAQHAIHQERSILGDEMGLGKTVQALAVMAHLAAKGQTRFLVVCPASVQINWLNEIGKHTSLAAHSLHGADRDAAVHQWRRAGGIAVTTFTTLGRLEDIAGDGIAMLVVDEAHYMKNPDSQRAKNVATIIAQAQRALFLTGTPMENRVEEFRNLVHHLQPRIARGLDPADALAGAKRFRRAVAPVYLRRNQEDVLTELPDKIEVEDWVQFGPDDTRSYAAAVRSGNIMQMRQAAFFAPRSAKLDRLAEIVEEAREDDLKVVIFSNFLGVLNCIHARIGDVVGQLTGAVRPAARQALVDEFTRRPGHAVLLNQIEAGGVGLNVQAASVVIIAEPQWKPSTEDQAIARAYRMGQIRKVQVHRLLAKGSVDERLREVQAGKSLLFEEFARKSDAKEADSRAVDASEYRPPALGDETVPETQRIIRAEQHRLGIQP